MLIHEALLSQIKCCLSNDGHIVEQPILTKCGSNCCRKCIVGSNDVSIFCFNCRGQHMKGDLIDLPINKITELVISTYIGDLYEYLQKEMDTVIISLREDTLMETMDLKFLELENDMDIRVESLIAELHKFREEFRADLNKFQEIYKKTVQNKQGIKIDKDLHKLEKNKINPECFYEKQNRLQFYKNKLKFFKANLNLFKFNPSDYIIEKQDLGMLTIKNNFPWITNSNILKEEELSALFEMSHSINADLVYRGSRDGFDARAFHTKCDSVEHTITIIKSNFDSVFGGYTSVAWKSDGLFRRDPNAYLFSLRRKGVFQKEVFKVVRPENAIRGHHEYGPIFGGGVDIFIADKSNTNGGNLTNFGHSYKLPRDFSYADENTESYLAGKYCGWLVVEIEVYRIG